MGYSFGKRPMIPSLAIFCLKMVVLYILLTYNIQCCVLHFLHVKSALRRVGLNASRICSAHYPPPLHRVVSQFFVAGSDRPLLMYSSPIVIFFSLILQSTRYMKSYLSFTLAEREVKENISRSHIEVRFFLLYIA